MQTFCDIYAQYSCVSNKGTVSSERGEFCRTFIERSVSNERTGNVHSDAKLTSFEYQL